LQIPLSREGEWLSLIEESLLSDLSARLAGLSPKRRELLMRQLAGKPSEMERIPRQPRNPQGGGGDRFPVSFSQLREWILMQLDPGTAAYNIPGGARITGPFNPRAFARSVEEIVRRHEPLRTTFAATAGEPVQVIAPPGPVSMPLIDLSGLPDPEREAEAERLTALEQVLSFDLARGPLLRVALLRLAEREHTALFTMHHIVSDGWSLGVFHRELAALYEAFSTGAPPSLPELPVQYADFAVWQREKLQGEVLEAEIDFWRRQLEGVPPVLALPTDRPRPPVQTVHGAKRSASLPAGLVPAVKALGLREGASLFMVLLAAFQALLARVSGQDDVAVGTYTGNRARSELEGLIGFFINTLVLRTRMEDGPTFRGLVGRVRETTLGAFAHQDIPFEKLLDALRVPRDLSHTPLFQSLLVVQNFPAQDVTLSEVSLSAVRVDTEHANFDLSLFLAESGEKIGGTAQYNADLFDAATIDRLVRHFTTLLEEAVRDPDRPVHELPLLRGEERDQILTGWSGAGVPSEGTDDRPVHALFADRAKANPEALAVDTVGTVTYRELEERANRLARHLRGLGVGPEVIVGVAAGRSPEMVAGLLAVLKAGGAYLPLDPAWPAERMAWMLEDAHTSVLLAERGLEIPGRRVVPLEGGDWEAEDPAPLPAVSGPENAAYLLYTSGSTGRPKGVIVEHRALAHYALDAAAAYGVHPGDRVLQFASIGFDTSAEEIYPALLAGATLVPRPESMLDSVPRFLAELDRLGITLLNLPTAWWHELAAGLEDASLPARVRRIILGGERALGERLALWRRGTDGHPARLVNTYGPTEATVVTTRHELEEVADGAEIPIGRPIAGARVYVVDGRGQLVPQGVAGELWIGGAGLARGYLGRPGLTAAAFVPDPFGGTPGARLYRTGDLARFREGGVLEFLGRIDGQVKIRGFRVEPGEVENALAGHPGLRSVAVAVHEPEPGAPRLAAYVVPSGEEAPTATELRRFLAAKLPDAWIPSAFVTLPELPLTASGKVDRRALPKPEPERPRLEREYLPPATEVEEALAAIWAEVLGIERVGVQDNFFELGGHSLLATQVVARVRERLQVDLPLLHLFQMPTVEQLAVVVEERILDRLEALGEEEVQALL
jgi:amino acid adenylation domain-containing protein